MAETSERTFKIHHTWWATRVIVRQLWSITKMKSLRIALVIVFGSIAVLELFGLVRILLFGLPHDKIFNEWQLATMAHIWSTLTLFWTSATAYGLLTMKRWTASLYLVGAFLWLVVFVFQVLGPAIAVRESDRLPLVVVTLVLLLLYPLITLATKKNANPPSKHGTIPL